MEILTAAFKFRWLTDVDLRHWFFQFSLHEQIQAFFCVRDRAGVYSMSRMPMGWSWSMVIAQSVAAALAEPGAVTFVDGFLNGGQSYDEAVSSTSALLTRLAKVGATVNLAKSHVEPAQRRVFVGLDIDVAARCWRLDPEWVAKVAAFLPGLLRQRMLPLRSWFRVAGIIIWSLRATLRPLVSIFGLLDWMRMSTRGSRPSLSSWDRECALSTDAHECVSVAMGSLLSNMWNPWYDTAGTIRIVSDASLVGWANVLDNSAHFGLFETSYRHSYLAEMEAAWRAIWRVVHEQRAVCQHIILEVDCTAVRSGIRAGYSSDRKANDRIADIYKWLATARCRISVVWAPGHNNAADRWTRPPYSTSTEGRRKGLYGDDLYFVSV
jgi:hypothetical protein